MSMATFQMHWEHRRNRKGTWYVCATRPEILKPSRETCDAPALMKLHRLAHRIELCECRLTRYSEIADAVPKAASRKPGMRELATRLRRRVPLPSTTKETIRTRAGNRCEDCKRPLAAVRRTTHPAIWAEARLRVFPEYPCHRCHRTFAAVLVEFGDQVIEPWLDDDEIGRAVTQIFPTFFWDYSRTLGNHYWANHCPHCGAMQGGFWISEYGGQGNISPLRSFRRKVQDSYVEIRETRWGHFHHVDGDPSNNDPGNVALLCVRCHDSRHSKGAASPSRSTDATNG